MGSRLFAVAALLMLAGINWQLYLQGQEMQAIRADMVNMQAQLDDIENEVSDATAGDGSEAPSNQPMNDEAEKVPGSSI